MSVENLFSFSFFFLLWTSQEREKTSHFAFRFIIFLIEIYWTRDEKFINYGWINEYSTNFCFHSFSFLFEFNWKFKRILKNLLKIESNSLKSLKWEIIKSTEIILILKFITMLSIRLLMKINRYFIEWEKDHRWFLSLV